MKHLNGIFRILLLTALCSPAAAATQQPVVRILTALGAIDVRVDAEHAPVTAANFLKYVDHHFYDAGRFHRAVTLGNQPTDRVKIEVIQASVSEAHQHDDFPPIPLERTSSTGLRHLAGTVSMARDGPDSATSDFFICVTDQSSLDFAGARNPDGQGFAAFGRVVAGMDIVQKIQQGNAVGQVLAPPVAILSMRRLPQSK